MEYKITDKSLEAAKRKYGEIYYGPGSPNNAATAFNNALDALRVPREAGEKGCSTCKDTGRVECPYCIKGLHSLECPDCSKENLSKPTPIGPGSRFRMPNGDEVMVIEDQGEYAAVNITTRTFLHLSIPHRWHSLIVNLYNALEAAGAECILEVEGEAESNEYFVEMVDRGDKIDAQADLLQRCEKVVRMTSKYPFEEGGHINIHSLVALKELSQYLLNDLEAYKEVNGG